MKEKSVSFEALTCVIMALIVAGILQGIDWSLNFLHTVAGWSVHLDKMYLAAGAICALMLWIDDQRGG